MDGNRAESNWMLVATSRNGQQRRLPSPLPFIERVCSVTGVVPPLFRTAMKMNEYQYPVKSSRPAPEDLGTARATQLRRDPRCVDFKSFVPLRDYRMRTDAVLGPFVPSAGNKDLMTLMEESRRRSAVVNEATSPLENFSRAL